ncbi:MAG: hypothetical protein IT236_04510 [Bacteroidia bacterium]|nr:hypothetical protein [Bacteroidia bacterium]
MKAIISIFFLSLFASELDEYKTDVSAAVRELYSINNYSMLVRNRLYLDGSTKKVFQERNTKICRVQKNLSVVQDNGEEYLHTSQHNIAVDRKEKTVSIQNAIEEKSMQDYKEKIKQGIEETMDLITESYDKITVLYRKNDKICYNISFKDYAEMENAKVIINRKTKMFESVSYTYRKKQAIHELNNALHKVTIETEYLNYTTSAVNNPGLFDEGKYISVLNGKMTLSAACKGYQLNNYCE